MNDVRKIIGQNIRLQRARLHLTQKQLADRISELSGRVVSASTVSKWETATIDLPAHILPDISSALECSSFALYPVSRQYSARDVALLDILRSLPAHQKDILYYMLIDWQGDADALFEFGLLYAVLPEWRRQYIAHAGIHEYREAQADDLPEIDDTIPVDLSKIVRAMNKLRNK